MYIGLRSLPIVQVAPWECLRTIESLLVHTFGVYHMIVSFFY